MNFSPDFIRTAPFQKFKRGIGKPEALEYLFNLTQRCQVHRTDRLPLGDDLELQLCMGLPDDVDASETRELMVSCGFIAKFTDIQSDLYRVDIFKDMNSGLISRWENGNKGGRPKGKVETVRASYPDQEPAF